jgi:hypothetical protein
MLMLQAVSLHTSHARDDSYTPSRISIRAGTGLHDLQEVSEAPACRLQPTHGACRRSDCKSSTSLMGGFISLCGRWTLPMKK